MSKVKIDLKEYAKRVCVEKCRFYKATQEVLVVNGDGNKQKWSWLWHSQCVNCPLEAMLQVLAEEHDQMAELDLELV